MHPFFSIVIPVYNVAPYLCECLDSVQAQTFGNWEALCVDDGSTDTSASILDKYAAKDARFRIVHQANAGVSAARNAALDMAKGEWICFLDSDDKIECHWLEDIANGARKHPDVDWIRTSYRDWLEGRDPKPWPANSVHTLSEKVLGSTMSAAWDFLAASAMLVLNVIRRENLRGVRFQRGLAYCEDSCFLLDYAKNLSTKSLLTIPNDDYRYRMRDSSASHSMKYHDVTESLEAVLLRWSRSPGRRGVFSTAIDRYVFRCFRAGRQMTRGEARQFRSFLWKAFRCGFFSPWQFKGRKRVRWFLFMWIGNPQIVFGKAGLNWFLPYEHKEVVL